MRKIGCIIVLALVLAGAAYADLQNVVVGGLIEIRGRWYHNAFETGNGPRPSPTPQLRIAPNFMPRRATGQANNGVLSMFRYKDWGNDWHFVEQTTSLNVAANFTDNVTAFIELYDFTLWGEDFRSNYITGVDARAVTNDDIEVLQSYVEVRDLLGQSLRLRLGRQVMQFGRDLNAFLLAGKTSPTQRFAYDGVRLTYTGVEKLTLDAWWMKLAERSPIEEDGDGDFYGVYGTYAFSEAANLSAYWLWIRDMRALKDTNANAFESWVEDLVGLDDYDGQDFHTVGMEFKGKYANFDYQLQVAYQFGDAGQLGTLFRKVVPGWGNLVYGDDDAEYDNWGGEFTVGYTFADTAWKFRPYVAGCYFEGGDERDVSFWEWINPFDRAKASVSFNRLFSDINYCPVVNDNADMSNYWQIGGGVAMTPAEKLSVTVRAYGTFADKTFNWPMYINVPQIRWLTPTGRLFIAPQFSFWDKESDDYLGFSMDTIWVYKYSKDWTWLLYYGHLWPGDGLRDGAYVSSYGTLMNGGLDDQGADYVFWWSILRF